MDLLKDLGLFFLVPGIVVLWAVLCHRGDEPCNYKIIRETNSLGEMRYEVWFEYAVFFWNPHTWCLKEIFDTEQLAMEFVARQKNKKREVLKQGQLN